MDDQELDEIIDNNPFAREEPTEYERWTYAAILRHNVIIMGMNLQMQRLQKALEEHNNLHNAVNRANMEVQSVKPAAKDDPIQ